MPCEKHSLDLNNLEKEMQSLKTEKDLTKKVGIAWQIRDDGDPLKSCPNCSAIGRGYANWARAYIERTMPKLYQVQQIKR